MPGYNTDHEAHQLHIPHLHLPFHKELTELYASFTIRGFAIYLIGIFEPIYLYLFFDKSLSLTFLFIGIISLFFGLLAPYGAKILGHIGLKHTMLISIPFQFLYFLGLWQIEQLGVFVWAIPILGIASKMLYWPAYHIDFARFSDKAKRGREVGYRTIMLSAAAAAAPFVGGFIIANYGFPELFGVVLALLFASMIPLFLTKDIKEDYHDRYKDAFTRIFKKRNRKKVVAFGAVGVDFAVQAYIWPLFLFALAISFEELGVITSASLLIGIIFTYFISKAADKIGSERMLGLGSVLSAVFWPVKMFVQTPFDAFLANTLHRFGRTASAIPFAAIFYDWASEHETTRDKNVIIREMGINITRGTFMLLMALLFFFIDNLAVTFLIAMVAALVKVLIVDDLKLLLNKK